MPGRHTFVLLFVITLAGCEDTLPTVTSPASPRPDTATQFDAASTGTIEGRVIWQGAHPLVTPLRSIPEPLTDQPPPPARDWPNPNAVAIGSKGGVASVVVYLRGVDVTHAKPWGHPSVSIELAEHRFDVKQGPSTGRIGFVRAGDAVRLVSMQDIYHSVQARGSAFFSLTFPEREKPRERSLSAPGLVELSSASGYYWMRAYLFVDHHPYYTLTDAQGRFTLADVPAGKYELIAWHPNPRVAHEERNQDSFRIQKVRFEPALQTSRQVAVTPKSTSKVDLTLGQRR